MTDSNPENQREVKDSFSPDREAEPIMPTQKLGGFSTFQAVAILFAIAVAITAGQCYYENQIIPSRPISWKEFDAGVVDEAVKNGKRVAILFETEDSIEAVDLLDRIESPEVRKLLYKNGFVTFKASPAETKSEITANTPVWIKGSGFVLVWEKGDQTFQFEAPLDDSDAIRKCLHELRFGKAIQPE